MLYKLQDEMPIAEMASMKVPLQAWFCNTENQSLCHVAASFQVLRSCAKNRRDATWKNQHTHTHTPSHKQTASVPCDQDLFDGQWPKLCFAVLLETGRRVQSHVRMRRRP